MKHRYTTTPFAGNKANYDPILDTTYDTILDPFVGSGGGTLQTAIVNPQCVYRVAEQAPTQRALIEGLAHDKHYFDTVCIYATKIIGELFTFDSYSKAVKWLSGEYDNAWYEPILPKHYFAALSVLRRFFFSSILRTTPGSGNLNVWLSVRKTLGDKIWKQKCLQYFPIVDYKSLNTAQVKQFNADLAEFVFRDGSLKEAMLESIVSWRKSIQPLLNEWFSVDRKIEVYNDYSELLKPYFVQGRTILYIDPPYFNDQTGTFIDEDGRKRKHKMTPAYEHHDPQSLETWGMMTNTVYFGVKNGCDMVLCNYTTPNYTALLEGLKTTHDLEIMVSDKSCLCTGKRNKYNDLPLGKETVVYAKLK